METQSVEYSFQGKAFEAHLALPDSDRRRLPLVFVFHAWGGRNSFACKEAEKLAELGYVGAALDMYGKGVLGSNPEENSALMQPLIDDRALLKNLMLTAIEAVQSHPLVDQERLGAIGFCFGGLCALDLARSGAPIKGVVSLHGLLHAPKKSKEKAISSKVLVLHGHEDPMVPPEQVAAFEEEMTQAKVDWQLHTFGHTAHGFTNPSANDPKQGVMYSPAADKRSRQVMEQFLSEVLC